MNAIEWSDSATKNSLHIARETSLKEDLYWTLNQTKIIILKNSEKAKDYIRLKIILDTTTPNFSYFKARVNGKETILKDTSELDWIIRPGDNTFSASSINAFGKEGRQSLIELNFII
jgi:hypothetical protein